MLKPLALAGAAAFALSGCIYVDDGDGSSGSGSRGGSYPMRTAWQTVYGARVAADALYVRVASNGCMDQNDFDVTVRETVDVHDRTVYRVRLRREDRDRCDGEVRGGEEVRFSFEELDIPRGAIVVVTHPFRDHVR